MPKRERQRLSNNYFYSEYQDTFGEIEVLVPGIQFVQGLVVYPILCWIANNSNTRNLYIMDDMMGEKDGIVAKLFTKKLHPQKSWKPQCHLHRTKFISCKNVRDVSQVTHLGKQLYPNNTKFFSTSLSDGNERAVHVFIYRLDADMSR